MMPDAIVRAFRTYVPARVRSSLSRMRMHVDQWAAGGSRRPPWDRDFPWCSPNVWRRIEEIAESTPQRRIFEYGTGSSTLRYVDLILREGGSYQGVEHDLEWFFEVVGAILRRLAARGIPIVAEGGPVSRWIGRHEDASSGYDIHLRNPGDASVAASIKLNFRPPDKEQTSSDGDLTEFASYVAALDRSADIIVVDGRARNACVRHVLDERLLAPAGLLVLFEAWRGSPIRGYPTLRGTSDYQPSVSRMLSLGAEMIDGDGFDTWPGQTWRRTPGAQARNNDNEACFLRNPARAPGIRHDSGDSEGAGA